MIFTEDLDNAGELDGCIRFDAVSAVKREDVDPQPIHRFVGRDMERIDTALRDALGL